MNSNRDDQPIEGEKAVNVLLTEIQNNSCLTGNMED